MEWIQLSAGQGPDECCRVLWHVLQEIEVDAQKLDLNVECLSMEKGAFKNSFRSVLLRIDGDAIAMLKKNWQGSICWRGASPFRPHHKRKNWFVQVNFLTVPQAQEFDLSQVTFEALRGGGPGGQHVNKSATAIRATYQPLNLSVFCQEERSQLRNKELALARIKQMVNERQSQKGAQQKSSDRLLHYQLERGNPTRSFSGKL